MDLSWILSKVENLPSSSLQDEVTDSFFSVLILGPSLIINLSPSVALPAEHVCTILSTFQPPIVMFSSDPQITDKPYL